VLNGSQADALRIPAEEEQGTEREIMRRSHHVLLDRQVGEVRAGPQPARVARASAPAEELNEAPDDDEVGLLRPVAHVLQAHDPPAVVREGLRRHGAGSSHFRQTVENSAIMEYHGAEIPASRPGPVRRRFNTVIQQTG
jgi:hypothetical protein